jgi:hypothetical protein
MRVTNKEDCALSWRTLKYFFFNKDMFGVTPSLTYDGEYSKFSWPGAFFSCCLRFLFYYLVLNEFILYAFDTKLSISSEDTFSLEDQLKGFNPGKTGFDIAVGYLNPAFDDSYGKFTLRSV